MKTAGKDMKKIIEGERALRAAAHVLSKQAEANASKFNFCRNTGMVFDEAGVFLGFGQMTLQGIRYTPIEKKA